VRQWARVNGVKPKIAAKLLHRRFSPYLFLRIGGATGAIGYRGGGNTGRRTSAL
jgi:hypothetical protein